MSVSNLDSRNESIKEFMTGSRGRRSRSECLVALAIYLQIRRNVSSSSRESLLKSSTFRMASFSKRALEGSGLGLPDSQSRSGWQSGMVSSGEGTEGGGPETGCSVGGVTG